MGIPTAAGSADPRECAGFPRPWVPTSVRIPHVWGSHIVGILTTMAIPTVVGIPTVVELWVLMYHSTGNHYSQQKTILELISHYSYSVRFRQNHFPSTVTASSLAGIIFRLQLQHLASLAFRCSNWN